MQRVGPCPLRIERDFRGGEILFSTFLLDRAEWSNKTYMPITSARAQYGLSLRFCDACSCT
jgi:hypothetical protein